MNLILPLSEFNLNCVHFGEKQKNTVIWNSFFIKLIYSNPEISLNGIFLLINLKQKQISKDYNKYKIKFNITNNHDLIHRIELIEKTILHKINIVGKTPRLSIYEQFKNGHLKLNLSNDYFNQDDLCILKLSGVWENSTEYGITFKYFLVNHPSSNNSQSSALSQSILSK
jgi:hypothetical protein